jgi:hypothetical protein
VLLEAGRRFDKRMHTSLRARSPAEAAGLQILNLRK